MTIARVFDAVRVERGTNLGKRWDEIGTAKDTPW